MQCPFKNHLYVINKKRLAQDLRWLDRKKIINLRNQIAIHGTERLDKIADEMTKSKEWVFFNRKPSDSKYKLQKQLYQMGYFDFFETGCGKCEVCRTQKSKQWATKAECEGRCWKNKTFITLTYNSENLPKDRKLDRKHIQKFWKRLRYHTYKHTKKEPFGRFEELEMEEIPQNELRDMFDRNYQRKNKKPIRYINCGEYGPKTKRPHYHAVIYNFKPDDLKRYARDRRGYWLYTSKKLEEIWGKGFVIIGNATTDTAAYVARYCTKKMKRTMEEEQRMKDKKQIEFIGASSWGFIGYYYWIEHSDEIKRNWGVFVNNHKGTHLMAIPKTMEKQWKEENDYEYEEYKQWKEINAKEQWKQILAKTDLSEEEYIKQIWEDREQKLVKLQREYDEKPTVQQF